MDKRLGNGMYDKPINVLFVGTANCVRSILAQDLLNKWGRGVFVGYSAGSHAKGWVHPFALKLLEYVKFPTQDLRSKSWNEFVAPYAPRLDFVFTVCDNAACEISPVWTLQPPKTLKVSGRSEYDIPAFPTRARRFGRIAAIRSLDEPVGRSCRV